jgi:hypothetical protein
MPGRGTSRLLFPLSPVISWPGEWLALPMDLVLSRELAIGD